MKGAFSAGAPPLLSPATPDKRGRIGIPTPRRCLEPLNNRRHRPGIGPLKGPALDNALDRLGHIEPTAAQRGIQDENALLITPIHPLDGLVSGQIIHHQQQSQGRRVGPQAERERETRLPALPQTACVRGRLREGGRQGRQDRRQFLL